MTGHAHNHGDEATCGRLWFAIIFTSSVLLAEVIGGLWSGSLALLGDAAHVFMDVVALALSLMALKISARPVDDRRTYGWHRAEVLAALINGMLLVVVAVGILHEAYERMTDTDIKIHLGGMMIVATIGLVANGVVALKLGGHHHGDINVGAAYLHVLSDMLASVGVVLGGAAMMLTGEMWIDSAIAACIALLIIVGAVRVLLKALHILLEGVPAGMDINDVAAAITSVGEVTDAHHLHIWSICSNVNVLSCHVEVDNPQNGNDELIGRINKMLHERFHIADTTIQIDDARGEHEKFIEDHGHPVRHHNHDHGQEHETADPQNGETNGQDTG